MLVERGENMGIFISRKIPLAIRHTKNIGSAKSAISCANKAVEQKIIELNCHKGLCSCNECKSNEYTKYNGTNRGMRKFCCTNSAHKMPVYFSTSTSYEAIKIYQETMAGALCQFIKSNSIIKGIEELNETSKYFVEYALECLYDFIKKNPQERNIKLNDEIATVFFDLSGSGLAKNKAIILAKIGGRIIFEVVTTSNHLSTHKLLAAIEEKLQISDNTKLVFITDGETCFVDPIKHFFPNAIHIRQFHSKSSKGIIYIHLNFDGKEYTVRCLWDAVLNEGEPSESVLRKREQRAKKKLAKKSEIEKKIRYSELSKDVMIWEGTVYEPRGVRRIIRKKSKNINKGEYENNAIYKKNTSPPDASRLIFRGSLEEAKKIEVFGYCFEFLKKIFSGLHITSNIVENVFNIKSKLKPHKTMKSGERILVCTLYAQIILKDFDKNELANLLKEKVITSDFIKQYVLCGTGMQKNKQETPPFLETIKEAINTRKKLILHYCDRNQKNSSRTINPLNIITNKYDNTTKIEAYCYLRKQKRTFCLERIRDVAIFDTKAICF